MNGGITPAPEAVVGLTTTEKFSFDAASLAAFHFGALRQRFEDLKDKVPMLRRFAETQQLAEISSIEDGALLLVPHTIYKSYPLSALEKNRFDTLTRWLGTLTSLDLSGVNLAGCETLDGWIDALDAGSELRVRHSSGTTGKLSFIPASASEAHTAAMGFKRYFEGFGDERDARVDGIGEFPVVSFAHRKGASSNSRLSSAIVKYLYGGDETKFIPVNPGRMSADMLSLGGRLEGARAKGEIGQVQLSPALLARRDEFAREQAAAPAHLRRFFEQLQALRGTRVILQGILPAVFEAAAQGLAQGLEALFDPASPFMVVGGAKGRVLPDDYQAQITRFSGVAFPRTGYGMTEAASGLTRMCPRGHFHIPPNIIPYLLDPVSGAPLPRRGVQKGRYGFVDIATTSRWGGFLTGDEMTLDYGDTGGCGCGRRGAFIAGEIRRYSDSEGGDDKITCAGAPAVHDKALEFLAEQSQ